MRIGSCKLSYEIISKLMMPSIIIMDEDGVINEIPNVNSTEIDLLIYFSLKQDTWGKVEGIYYKEAMLDLGLTCKQSFYNALSGLELKGYIHINYQRKDSFWGCTILNNIFNGADDDKLGYFKTNRQFLHTHKFRSLKANEKKICIRLALSYQDDNYNKFGLQIYPKTVASWIGLKSTHLIYGYMENIKEFFPYSRRPGFEGDLLYFEKGIFTPFEQTQKSERDHYLTHKIKHFCSAYKIAYTLTDLKDLIILMGQYAHKGIGKLMGTICHVLISKRSIEPKLINSILSGTTEIAPGY